MPNSISAFITLISLLVLALPAHAYVGPGMGLSAIAAFLAVISALFITFFGFIWLPLKRKWNARKGVEDKEETDEPQKKNADKPTEEQE